MPNQAAAETQACPGRAKVRLAGGTTYQPPAPHPRGWMKPKFGRPHQPALVVTSRTDEPSAATTGMWAGQTENWIKI